MLINYYELIMTDDGFDKLLLLDKPTLIHTKRVKTSPSPTASGTSNKIGRLSLASQFPEIVSATTSFIKANGYGAHERRREQSGKVGVSLQEIKDHLVTTFPGLNTSTLVSILWLASCNPLNVGHWQVPDTEVWLKFEYLENATSIGSFATTSIISFCTSSLQARIHSNV